eukprot:m.229883 g.229883  ORF g.229883 m.229883 type:complete len:163 (-) comp33564_c16_seq1:107-595(-)
MQTANNTNFANNQQDQYQNAGQQNSQWAQGGQQFQQQQQQQQMQPPMQQPSQYQQQQPPPMQMQHQQNQMQPPQQQQQQAMAPPTAPRLLPTPERAGDWVCVSCANMNFASRTTCRRCNAAKPAPTFQTGQGGPIRGGPSDGAQNTHRPSPYGGSNTRTTGY